MVKRCQFAFSVNGQSQQVDVGDLRMGDDRIGFDDLQKADIISPEVMARGLTKLTEDGIARPSLPPAGWGSSGGWQCGQSHFR